MRRSLICPLHAHQDCLRELRTDAQIIVKCSETGHVVETLQLGTSTPERSPARRATPRSSIITQSAWDRYFAWNAALANTLFDGRHAGRPVYIDMEADLLEEMAGQVGVSKNDALNNFLASVRATLRLPSMDYLLPHMKRLRKWRNTAASDEPPVLALLGLFSLAAESMRGSESMAPNNFYGRLLEALDVDEEHKDAIAAGYRANATQLWKALNDWLKSLDGEKGLPTAVKGGSTDRYVHLSVSQALMRDVDRRRLIDMFDHYGLQAGSIMSIADADRLLGEFAASKSCTFTGNFKRLIKKPDVRQRIAALVPSELENWDGVLRKTAVAAGAGSTQGDLRLLASIGGFPRRRLRLMLGLVTDREPDEEVSVAVDDPDVADAIGGDRLQTTALSAGVAVLAAPAQPRWLRLLGRNIQVQPEDGPQAERPARRLATLRHEPQLNLFAEVERLQLGEESMLLVHSSLMDLVDEALEEAARPGWAALADLPGTPDGWIVYRNVQLLVATSSPHMDLRGLVPASFAQATFGGGLRLPGRTTRWHRDALPELRVSAVEHKQISVRLTTTRCLVPTTSANEPVDLGRHAGVSAISLPESRLCEGDHVVTVLDADSNEQVLAATLRIRSGDTLSVERVGHAPLELGRDTSDAARAVVSAWVTNETTSMVGGSAPEAPTTEVQQAPLQTRIPWLDQPDEVDDPDLLTEPSSEGAVAACFYTGAHYIQLPTAGRYATRKQVEGVCRDCGIRKFLPTRPKQAINWKPQQQQPRSSAPEPTSRQDSVDLSNITEIVPDLEVDPNTILDALVHLRDGTGHQLRQIVDAGGDRLRGTWVQRNLEALGHIEVERDRNLDDARWRICPTTMIIGQRDDDAVAFLAGIRTTRLLDALHEHPDRGLVALEVQKQVLAPSRVLVRAGSVHDIKRLASELASQGLDVRTAADAPRRIAAIAGSMSRVIDLLPEQPMPSRAALKRLDLPAVRWQRADAAEAPGVYRVDLGYRALHTLRRVAELEAGTFRSGPQELIKHAGANQEGHLLLSYVDGQLLTPPKVGLPGLYERAAVLSTGLAPEERGRRHLVYPDVPSEVATLIARKLAT